MSPHAQHPLLCALLLWTFIVSISQVVLFILLFTSGSNVKISESAEPTPDMQHYTTTPQQFGPRWNRGKMLTFRATRASSSIHWVSKSQSPGLISEGGERLNIRKGGFYFISVQVSLTSCEEETQLRRTVRLKLNNDVILLGWIHATTNSTGLLSKVEEVSTGVTLTVTINPPVTCFNYEESLTHLDMVYLPR